MMIRSTDTLQHSFNLLQKRQETVSANIANVHTPAYRAKQLIQGTTEERILFNRLGGAERNRPVELDTLSFSNQIEEVYEKETSGGWRINEITQELEENSNVNMADEMVALMKISREFEANQKALNAGDETLRKAANEIGKV